MPIGRGCLRASTFQAPSNSDAKFSTHIATQMLRVCQCVLAQVLWSVICGKARCAQVGAADGLLTQGSGSHLLCLSSYTPQVSQFCLGCASRCLTSSTATA
jgi:hypothetical protein